MGDEAQNFHIEEYRALRAEMLYLFKEVNDAFRFYLTGISAIIAWLLTLPPPRPDDIWLRAASAWIPFVLVIIMAVSTARSAANIRNIGHYLLRLEERYAEPDLGWERAGERRDFRHKMRFSVFFGYITTGLLVATFAVGVSITCNVNGVDLGDVAAWLHHLRGAS